MPEALSEAATGNTHAFPDRFLVVVSRDRAEAYDAAAWRFYGSRISNSDPKAESQSRSLPRGNRELRTISWQGCLGSIPSKCSLPGESFGMVVERLCASFGARSVADRSQDGLSDFVGTIRLAQQAVYLVVHEFGHSTHARRYYGHACQRRLEQYDAKGLFSRRKNQTLGM